MITLNICCTSGTGKHRSQDLLRLSVALGLAVLAHMVLVALRSLMDMRCEQLKHRQRGITHLVGGGGGDELVGQLGLVRRVDDLVEYEQCIQRDTCRRLTVS